MLSKIRGWCGLVYRGCQVKYVKPPNSLSGWTDRKSDRLEIQITFATKSKFLVLKPKFAILSSNKNLVDY